MDSVKLFETTLSIKSFKLHNKPLLFVIFFVIVCYWINCTRICAYNSGRRKTPISDDFSWILFHHFIPVLFHLQSITVMIATLAKIWAISVIRIPIAKLSEENLVLCQNGWNNSTASKFGPTSRFIQCRQLSFHIFFRKSRAPNRTLKVLVGFVLVGFVYSKDYT